MNRIQLFNVSPAVPEQLHFLEVLARNLWWCWNIDAIELFRRISPQYWRDLGHNPLLFLSTIPQERLEVMIEDDAFLQHLNAVQERFNASVSRPETEQPARTAPHCIGYFSLEYGIHESLRLYSGGLGVLAGDHLKAASDLGLPLVAVGLLYRQGYFRQSLDGSGWQREHYPQNEIQNMPLSRALDANGDEVQVTVPLPDGELRAIVWRLDVGRIPLYLLDTTIPENPPEYAEITGRLYGGGRVTRLRQELLLGIGGYRALLRMGYHPHVCHINEGHAAFLNIARVAHLMEAKECTLDAATEIAARTNVFTTHTPVPAGNEYFDLEILKPHLTAIAKEIPVAPEKVISWGTDPSNEAGEELSMTVFGLRLARNSNGVSELHGMVARQMWRHLWPGKPDDEIPVTHITNGVHVPSWLSPDNLVLYDRYLGPQWRNHPNAPRTLRRIAQIPDEELWHAHELSRSRLVRTSRELLEKQLRGRHASRAQIAQSKSSLDHDALTIGFARRFATYKRATLLLRDPARFEALLTNEDRPVQFIFAGKAHPDDHDGKTFIQELVRFANNPKVRRRIVFLEDYDIYTARYMLQGVDVWLNTPRRPMEASGTSGMKAAVNGGVNVSILDGWWCEGYAPDCGWAIGTGEEFDNPEYQDAEECMALYNLLENEVVPCFYDRPFGELPTLWVKMMKASIRMGLSFFTSHRMVAEYSTRFYEPSFRSYEELTANHSKTAKTFVRQQKRLARLWKHVAVSFPVADRDTSTVHVSDEFTVTSTVSLGTLRPEEVDVEVYYGPVDPQNHIVKSHASRMELVEDLGEGVYVYSQRIPCERTGRYGFTARVVPDGTCWRGLMPGFITWADGEEA